MTLTTIIIIEKKLFKSIIGIIKKSIQNLLLSLYIVLAEGRALACPYFRSFYCSNTCKLLTIFYMNFGFD